MDRNGGARSAPFLLVFAVSPAFVLFVIGMHSDHRSRHPDIGGASEERVQNALGGGAGIAFRRGMGGGAGIA